MPKAGISIRTGRKWDATKELRTAEERLRMKTIIGTVAEGTLGLGYVQTVQINKANKKEYRKFIQDQVRISVEEERMAKTVGLGQQGAWTRWVDIKQRKITWHDILWNDFSFTRFQIQAVYDALPSPANLQTWGKVETPACHLCTGRATLQHILSSCPRALNDGRYRWRRDRES